MRTFFHRLVFAAALSAGTGAALHAQAGTGLTPDAAERRWRTERQLESLAVIDRKLMIPMRDGVRIATDVYRPKGATGRLPVIFVRTPYNFNYWDVRNGVPRAT